MGCGASGAIKADGKDADGDDKIAGGLPKKKDDIATEKEGDTAAENLETKEPTSPPISPSELACRRGVQAAYVKTDSSTLHPNLMPKKLEMGLKDGLKAAPNGVVIETGPAAAQLPGTAGDEFSKMVVFDRLISNDSVLSNREETVIKEDSESVGNQMQKAIDLISDDLFNLPFSVSVSIPSIEDTPLIAISQGFIDLTGWSREEIVGRNCRFLLAGVPKDEISADMRLEARRYCKAAYLRGLTTMSHTILLQRNARKSGELFWNLFMLSLVQGPEKKVFVVGLQLDLGPELDPSMTPEAVIGQHRDKLEMVRHVMFGKKPEKSLCPTKTEAFAGVDFSIMVDEIKSWLNKAEGASEAYQEWGTMPWVAWSLAGTKFALLNGGVTILRMEGDHVTHGASVMSVFPVNKKTREIRFKVRIDAVCSTWNLDLSTGGFMPSFGFTEVTPIAMDGLGGLPTRIEMTAKSVCFRCDGHYFRRVRDGNYSPGRSESGEAGEYVIPAEEVMQGAQPESILMPYVVKVGDVMECVWGNGFIAIEVDGMEIYRAEDREIIGSPPKKTQLFAVFDCCHAVCKATLVS